MSNVARTFFKALYHHDSTIMVCVHIALHRLAEGWPAHAFLSCSEIIILQLSRHFMLSSSVTCPGCSLTACFFAQHLISRRCSH